MRMVGLVMLTGCGGIAFEGTWELAQSVEGVADEPPEEPVAYPYDLEGVQVRKEMRVTGDSLEIVDLRDAEESVEGPYVWSEMEDEVVVLGVADAFTCSVLADEAMCTAVFEGVGLPDFTIDQTWSRMP